MIRRRITNIILSITWAIVLICDIVAYMQGSAPSWGLVFPPVICLLLNSLTDIIVED